MKRTRCFVVDETMRIIIMAGDFVDMVYKDPSFKEGPSHVVVGYYESIDNAEIGMNRIVKVFPIEQVYFLQVED